MSKFVRSGACLFLILVILIYGCFTSQYKCTHVADGDTITVVRNGQKFKIRLIGIDAPEISREKNQSSQPYSQKSKKYLSSLVLNKYVDIVSYGEDRYGRTLGVVYVDGTNINFEMVRAGLAEVYRGKAANNFNKKPYIEAETEARKSKIGMWFLGDRYVSPWDWRKLNQ